MRSLDDSSLPHPPCRLPRSLRAERAGDRGSRLMPSPSRRVSSRRSPARDVSTISVNCTFTITCPKWTSLRDVRYRVPPYPSARSPPGTLRIARGRKECTRLVGNKVGADRLVGVDGGNGHTWRDGREWRPASVSSAAARSVAAIASRRAGPSSVGASTDGVGSPGPALQDAPSDGIGDRLGGASGELRKAPTESSAPYPEISLRGGTADGHGTEPPFRTPLSSSTDGAGRAPTPQSARALIRALGFRVPESWSRGIEGIMSSSGAPRRAGRTALVLLQLLVFVGYILGPTATLAEDPLPEPTPAESPAPERVPAPPSRRPAHSSLPRHPRRPPAPAPSSARRAEPGSHPRSRAVDVLAPGTEPYLITFAAGTPGRTPDRDSRGAGVTDGAAIPQLAHARRSCSTPIPRPIELGCPSRRAEVAARRCRSHPRRRGRALRHLVPRPVVPAAHRLGPALWLRRPSPGPRPSRSSTPVSTQAIRTSTASCCPAPRSWMDLTDGPIRTATAPGWPASSPPRPTTALGVAGTAYAGVSILPVTVLGADGPARTATSSRASCYAADAGADVILMAFSNPGYSAALQAAIDYAWASGAVLVAATGNDGSATATFPAGDRGVIGVASTDAADALAASSNSRRRRLHGRSWRRHRHHGRRRRRRHHLRHLGRRRLGRRRCRAPQGERVVPRPTASSSAAWPATPIRPAIQPPPATAASTSCAPCPTPRPTRFSLLARPPSATVARSSGLTRPRRAPWTRTTSRSQKATPEPRISLSHSR